MKLLYTSIAMKIKEWFKTFLAGIGIGIGSAIPGVSGGTIAVILKVYEKILWAVSNIFKEFKKAVIYLLPVLLGVVLSVIPMIYLMDKALNGFLFGIICLFTGFIIGSFPGVKDEAKGKQVKKSHIIALVIAFIIAVMLGVLSVIAKVDVTPIFVSHTWWLYLVLIPVGFIASIALVVPGLSGSMILLLIGFYAPLLSTTTGTLKDCLENGNWSNLPSLLGILVCFAIGVIIGFYVISKLMHFLLKKYRILTFYAIIGFIIGSTIALFFNYEIYQYYLMWSKGLYISVPYYIEVPIGVVLLLIACALSYLLVRYKRKIDIQKEERIE